jgi:Transposase, Mutator family
MLRTHWLPRLWRTVTAGAANGPSGSDARVAVRRITVRGRRTRVVRIFPNEASCLRLVRALAVEQHERWQEDHRYLNMAFLKEAQRERLKTAA